MVLITNADMPKSCLGELDGRNDCPWVGKCETFKKSHFADRVNKSWEQRLDGCPLVEIPDELETFIRTMSLFHCEKPKTELEEKEARAYEELERRMKMEKHHD